MRCEADLGLETKNWLTLFLEQVQDLLYFEYVLQSSAMKYKGVTDEDFEEL